MQLQFIFEMFWGSTVGPVVGPSVSAWLFVVNCFLQTYSLWADSLSLELLIICWLSVQLSWSARNFSGSHSVLLRVAPNGWRLPLLAGRGLYCWTWKLHASGIAICQWSIVWICFFLFYFLDLDLFFLYALNQNINKDFFPMPIAEQIV
jgi:hypothetical protein